MDKITNSDILGIGNSRTVQPRTVPHGYQVEQWERHEQAIDKARSEHPTLDDDSFMTGWNAAFTAIYGYDSRKAIRAGGVDGTRRN